MFDNLFNYEERENNIEFVEEVEIENVEELDTFVDKAIKFIQETGQVVVNSVIITGLLVGKAVKKVVKTTVKIITAPVVITKAVYDVRKARKAKVDQLLL